MHFQEVILLISVTLMLSILFIFTYVARHASTYRPYPPIQKIGYRNRSKLFWVLLLLGVLVSALSLTELPYGNKESAAPATIITVVGHQWYWEVSQSEVVAGEKIAFDVTSADVNHSLGIYNADLLLVAQTQAMPTYTNRLEYTFESPGIYKFLCLEYCGLAHHVMAFELKVVTDHRNLGD